MRSATKPLCAGQESLVLKRRKWPVTTRRADHAHPGRRAFSQDRHSRRDRQLSIQAQQSHGPSKRLFLRSRLRPPPAPRRRSICRPRPPGIGPRRCRTGNPIHAHELWRSVHGAHDSPSSRERHGRNFRSPTAGDGGIVVRWTSVSMAGCRRDRTRCSRASGLRVDPHASRLGQADCQVCSYTLGRSKVG